MSLLPQKDFTAIGLDKVRPADSGGRETIVCDILDRSGLVSAIESVAPDALIHLAARVDLEETKDLKGYAANIEGVRNVVHAVRRTPTIRRAIYTSSQLVCRVGYVPTRDTDYCPNTLYGESKVFTERVVREEDGGGIPWCLTRPTTVWGPYMSAHYQRMLQMICMGRYFHCGNRPLYKSYGYAGNVAHQYMRLLTAPADLMHRKTFYLADYEPLSLRAYTTGLAREMGAPQIRTIPLTLARMLAFGGDALKKVGIKNFPFTSFRLRNIQTEYVFDLSNTRAVCGPPPFTVEQGIRETARWFLSSTETAASKFSARRDQAKK
jgi:nucleoside-diphosphate-sugar epimerase